VSKVAYNVGLAGDLFDTGKALVKKD
jgi:hypothetical protein